MLCDICSQDTILYPMVAYGMFLCHNCSNKYISLCYTCNGIMVPKLAPHAKPSTIICACNDIKIDFTLILPKEIITMFAEYLYGNDLASFQLTSKICYNVVNSSILLNNRINYLANLRREFFSGRKLIKYGTGSCTYCMYGDGIGHSGNCSLHVIRILVVETSDFYHDEDYITYIVKYQQWLLGSNIPLSTVHRLSISEFKKLMSENIIIDGSYFNLT